MICSGLLIRRICLILGKDAIKGSIWGRIRNKCLHLSFVNSFAVSFLILFPKPPGPGATALSELNLVTLVTYSCWQGEDAKALIWGFTHHHAPENWVGLPWPSSPVARVHLPAAQKGAAAVSFSELACPFQLHAAPRHTADRWNSHSIQLTILKCTIQCCFVYL